MPINFAFALDRAIQMPHEQQLILETLRNTANINANLDFAMGGVDAAAKGGIDTRPGTPSFEKGLLFPLNRYFAGDVPGANQCSGKLAEVIEVMLDQQFYQVICLENFGAGTSAASSWKPWQIRKVAQARDFRKFQESEAQANRDAKAPPRPINQPGAGPGIVIDAPVVNASGSPYANNPGPGSDYANSPGGGDFVAPDQLGVPGRRATI